MTYRSLVLALTLTAAAAASSLACGEDEGTPTGSTCPPGSTLTYATFGQQFFATNCTSCHASRESPTLTSQAAIKANASAIDRVAAAGPNATNRAMPQTGTVSDDDRKKLGEWLACGAP